MHLRAGLLLLFLIPGLWAAEMRAEDEDNPHWMLRADGEPDEEKCALCHNEDMDLLASKEETCLSCHDRTLHSGSAEHLEVSPERVAALLPPRVEPEEAQQNLPLAEDGRMYCGTCHLFHDPRIAEEILAPVRPLPSHSVALAIRRATLARCQDLTREGSSAEFSFAPQNTAFLRLPLAEDELCVACHRQVQRRAPK